jgi:hypothetical protein
MKTSKDNFHFSRSLSEIPAFTTEYRARGASQLVTRFMSFDEARRQVSIAQVFYLQSSLGYLAKKSFPRDTPEKPCAVGVTSDVRSSRRIVQLGRRPTYFLSSERGLGGEHGLAYF